MCQIPFYVAHGIQHELLCQWQSQVNPIFCKGMCRNIFSFVTTMSSRPGSKTRRPQEALRAAMRSLLQLQDEHCLPLSVLASHCRGVWCRQNSFCCNTLGTKVAERNQINPNCKSEWFHCSCIEVRAVDWGPGEAWLRCIGHLCQL